jgi:hypothetical protein
MAEIMPVELQPQVTDQPVVFDLDGGKNKSRLPHMCGQSMHPFVALFHVVIKIGVIFLYLVLPTMFKPVTAYILMVVSSAIDFYFVKNISGRLLVGLKWWVEVTDDGI